MAVRLRRTDISMSHLAIFYGTSNPAKQLPGFWAGSASVCQLFAHCCNNTVSGQAVLAPPNTHRTILPSALIHIFIPSHCTDDLLISFSLRCPRLYRHRHQPPPISSPSSTLLSKRTRKRRRRTFSPIPLSHSYKPATPPVTSLPYFKTKSMSSINQ